MNKLDSRYYVQRVLNLFSDFDEEDWKNIKFNYVSKKLNDHDYNAYFLITLNSIKIKIHYKYINTFYSYEANSNPNIIYSNPNPTDLEFITPPNTKWFNQILEEIYVYPFGDILKDSYCVRVTQFNKNIIQQADFIIHKCIDLYKETLVKTGNNKKENINMADNELVHNVLCMFNSFTQEEWDDNVDQHMGTISKLYTNHKTYWTVINLIYKNINLEIDFLPQKDSIKKISSEKLLVKLGVTDRDFIPYTIEIRGTKLSQSELEYIDKIYHKAKDNCKDITMKKMIEETVNDYFESKGITNDNK